MKRVSWLGVLVGGIADYGGSSIAAGPLMVYVIVTRHLVGLPQDKLAAAVFDAIRADPLLLALRIVPALLCSVLGGWLAGRIAGHDEALNGFLSVWLSVAFGTYAIAKGTTHFPLWVALLLNFVIAPAAAWMGGLLARRRRPRRDVAVTR